MTIRWDIDAALRAGEDVETRMAGPTSQVSGAHTGNREREECAP